MKEAGHGSLLRSSGEVVALMGTVGISHEEDG